MQEPACGLQIRVARNHETMSREAARIILKALQQKPDLLLCVSAGGTPSLTYEFLAARGAVEPRLFSKLRVLQIDEWIGLPLGHPATCLADLRQKLLEPLCIKPNRVRHFQSDAAFPGLQCGRVAAWLEMYGPIDICLLGLGLNGHIAMNEPGPALTPHIHLARLAASSRKHSLLKHLARKPTRGFTLGMRDILCSRKILLLVNGPKKRAAVQRLLQPRVTTHFPASLLWLHPDATLLCDREAASAANQP